jgi:hypothetical protein
MANPVDILVTGTQTDPRVLQQAIVTLVQLKLAGVACQIVTPGKSEDRVSQAPSIALVPALARVLNDKQTAARQHSK